METAPLRFALLSQVADVCERRCSSPGACRVTTSWLYAALPAPVPRSRARGESTYLGCYLPTVMMAWRGVAWRGVAWRGVVPYPRPAPIYRTGRAGPFVTGPSEQTDAGDRIQHGAAPRTVRRHATPLSLATTSSSTLTRTGRVLFPQPFSTGARLFFSELLRRWFKYQDQVFGFSLLYTVRKIHNKSTIMDCKLFSQSDCRE